MKKTKAILLTIFVIVTGITIFFLAPYWIAVAAYKLFNWTKDGMALTWLAGCIIVAGTVLFFAIIGALTKPITDLYNTIYQSIK